jgi:hypothetical protein
MPELSRKIGPRASRFVSASAVSIWSYRQSAMAFGSLRRRARPTSPSLPGARLGRYVNGRVDRDGAEQQDRLAEHHGSELGRATRSAEPEHESDQQARGDAELLVLPSTIAEDRSWLGDRLATSDLHGEPGERHQLGARWRIARRQHSPVPHEGDQVEEPHAQPRDPEAHRQRADSVTSRNVADTLAALHGDHRREDYLDAGDFARQRIVGQHPLTVAAHETAGQRHIQHREAARCMQLAPHPRAGQPQS